MKKNIIIIILSTVLIVITCIYEFKNLKISAKYKNFDESFRKNDDIELVEVYDDFYLLHFNDKRLKISFNFDGQGLKKFWLIDEISEKKIGYNISKDGYLESYMYEDRQYTVMTNVTCVHPEILIQRAEWYNGYATIYEFLPDGSTNIIVNKEDVDIYDRKSE
jgi:hypothetical protein